MGGGQFYGSTSGEGAAVQPPRLAGAGLWGSAGRRAVAGTVALAVVVTCAAVAHLAGADGRASVGRFELVSLPHGEHKVVDAAEDATMSFASSDVTQASLTAQKEAKEQYARMMATALKAEAQAHKLGEKATALSFKAEDKAEHSKLVQQQQRAMRDQLLQARKDAETSSRLDRDVDRELQTRVLTGQ